MLFATSGKIIALTAEQKILVPDKVFWLRWFLIKGNNQGGIPLGSALLTFPRGKVSAARHERIKENHLLKYIVCTNIKRKQKSELSKNAQLLFIRVF